jgi:protein-disulfide isomerase
VKFGGKALPPLLAVSMGLTACVDPNDIKEIKKNQKQILEKLDEISKQRPAGPQQPQGPQPGRPDPNKVYAFEVGDSPQKGPKDAWVTVIEVSDFQ